MIDVCSRNEVTPLVQGVEPVFIGECPAVIGVSRRDRFEQIYLILSRLYQNLGFLGGYLGIRISSVTESFWSQTPSGLGIPSSLRTPSEIWTPTCVINRTGSGFHWASSLLDFSFMGRV
ncbi:UNVERIFIED_CONTAM: hypothetical protein Slati_1732400 [Sesamum latifolium]|uniref:Uncharacterized protein n=1 Tax=Sesamum latifolium TaxID=2727402 RepID=A0AAW2WX42_9LAMI